MIQMRALFAIIILITSANSLSTDHNKKTFTLLRTIQRSHPQVTKIFKEDLKDKDVFVQDAHIFKARALEKIKEKKLAASISSHCKQLIRQSRKKNLL